MNRTLSILLLVSCLSAMSAPAQISQFQHIIVIFQENRTPDNLFYALCASFPCSATPDRRQYNIQTANWLDQTSPTGVTQPFGIPLANKYGVDHSHAYLGPPGVQGAGRFFMQRCATLPGRSWTPARS